MMIIVKSTPLWLAISKGLPLRILLMAYVKFKILFIHAFQSCNFSFLAMLFLTLKSWLHFSLLVMMKPLGQMAILPCFLKKLGTLLGQISSLPLNISSPMGRFWMPSILPLFPWFLKFSLQDYTQNSHYKTQTCEFIFWSTLVKLHLFPEGPLLIRFSLYKSLLEITTKITLLQEVQ